MTDAELLQMARERGGTIGLSLAEQMQESLEGMRSMTTLFPAIHTAISEAEFMAKVVEHAKSRGWMVFHPYISLRSEPGWPDLSLVRASRLLFAELKKETGKQTAKQREWANALSQAGQTVYLWRPSDWQTIVEVLK